MSTTKDVLNHHLEMFGDGDLEGLMADYADDAVLITQNGTVEGHGEISAMYEELLPEFDDESVTFSLDDQTVVDGQTVPVGGDVLLAIDDRSLTTTEALGSYLALETRPGDTVDLTLIRDGEETTIGFELGTQPDQV